MYSSRRRVVDVTGRREEVVREAGLVYCGICNAFEMCRLLE
jgi:hypothetical protein